MEVGTRGPGRSGVQVAKRQEVFESHCQAASPGTPKSFSRPAPLRAQSPPDSLIHAYIRVRLGTNAQWAFRRDRAIHADRDKAVLVERRLGPCLTTDLAPEAYDEVDPGRLRVLIEVGGLIARGAP